MRPSSDDAKVIKLAVAFVDKSFEKRGEDLLKIDQSIPLAPQIPDVCSLFKISSEEASEYALQFEEEKNPESNDRYITEANRLSIKTGSMLKLTLSPEKMSEKIVSILKSVSQPAVSIDGNGPLVLKEDHQKLATKAMGELVRLSFDPEFIAHFNSPQLNGIDAIIEAIQASPSDGRTCGEFMEPCLSALVNMMIEGARPWDSLTNALVKKLLILSERGLKCCSPSVILSVLTVLENLVLACPEKFELIRTGISYPTLASYLADSKCGKTRQSVVAFINALLAKAPTEESRQQIGRNVSHDMSKAVMELVRSCGGTPWPEMLDQLYQLQKSLLALYVDRFLMVCDPGSSDDIDKIKHLRRVAFDEAGSGGGDRDKKRDQYSLGFSDETDPLKDFSNPPGRLYLDCLKHYADNHERQFARMAIENSSKDTAKFPMVELGAKLIFLLFEILDIQATKSAHGSMMNLGGSFAMPRNFQPMFFSSDHAFEELFCRTMDLFGRTWKEMKATVQDVDKVMDVVREQLERALDTSPVALSFSDFSEKLERLSYAEIKTLWDQERNFHDDQASRAEPIQQLRDALKLEIVGLIAEQRTLFLTDGSRFIKTSGPRRGKDSVKYWVCRLAPNRKCFHYGDCKEEEGDIPSIDSLTSKVELDQIKELILGDKCPHFNKGKIPGHYFSLLYSTDTGEQKTLDFITGDERTFNYWCDGITVLTFKDQSMNSREFHSDLEILISMEVKLRLLDIGALEIPDKAPEVPPIPKKFLEI